MERISIQPPERAIPEKLALRLALKRDLLLKGDPSHKEIKTALVVDGGGMAGSYSAGVLYALDKLGFANTFDAVFGASTGAGASAYFVSGQVHDGVNIFTEDLAQSGFIKRKRFWKIVGIDQLDKVFGKTKPLDQSAIKNGRTDLFIGVTDAQTGFGEFIDAKDPEVDIVKAIQASLSAPLIYSKNTKIGDRSFSDGVQGCGWPLEVAIGTGYTDILAVKNIPDFFQSGMPRNSAPVRIMADLLLPHYTVNMRNAFSHIDSNYRNSLKRALELWNTDFPGTNIGFISPIEQIGGLFTDNPQKLAEIIRVGTKQTLRMFKEALPPSRHP